MSIASNARRRRRGYGRSTAPARRKDRVTPELHAEVWDRDGHCIGLDVIPGHRCSGGPTVDHFHWIPGGKRSKRAPSMREHLAAMCRGLNVDGPSKALREEERRRARERYPEHGTETGCVCDA